MPAFTLARQLAGDCDAAMTASNVGGQAVALGLVDGVTMDVVPVVFGARQAVLQAFDAQ